MTRLTRPNAKNFVREAARLLDEHGIKVDRKGNDLVVVYSDDLDEALELLPEWQVVDD